jgi:hypothetical protein
MRASNAIVSIDYEIKGQLTVRNNENCAMLTLDGILKGFLQRNKFCCIVACIFDFGGKDVNAIGHIFHKGRSSPL